MIACLLFYGCVLVAHRFYSLEEWTFVTFPSIEGNNDITGLHFCPVVKIYDKVHDIAEHLK